MTENNSPIALNQTTPTDNFLDSLNTQEVSPPKPKFPLFSVILLLVLSVVSVIAIYLFLQVRELSLSQAAPSPTPSPLSSTVPTESWEQYDIKELGISFKYPPTIQPMDYPTGIENSGEKGKQLCLSFIPLKQGLNLVKSVFAGGGACSGTFSIGSTSIDYQAGREGGFGDYHGYRKEGDKYYAVFVGGKESEIDNVDVKEITNPNGVKMLVITGANSIEFSERGSESKPGNPGTGYIGALVNIDEQSFSGFNIQMKLDSTLTKEIFDQILSTFKFIDSQSTIYQKKHFLPSDKFFSNYPYPTEIANLKDENLISFSCSTKYNKQLDGSFVFYTNDTQQNQQDVLSDKSIIKYLATQNADTAMICTTDTGKKLLSYEIIGKGGGAGASAYYSYVEGDNTSVATIPMENGPYFACGTILAITKSNIMFVECASGDGGYGSKSLYKVDLSKADTPNLVFKCTTVMQDENSSPTITCGTVQ